MGLLLVRHSDAAQAAGQTDDFARSLTKSGRDKARAVALSLKQRGVQFDRFVTSPRVRAVQTAEIFAHVLGFSDAVISLPSLSYTVPAELAVRELSALSGHVAAFGHMPTLGEIAQLLTRSRTVSFATAEAVWIENGKLVWAIDPANAMTRPVQ